MMTQRIQGSKKLDVDSWLRPVNYLGPRFLEREDHRRRQHASCHVEGKVVVTTLSVRRRCVRDQLWSAIATLVVISSVVQNGNC